MVRDVINTLEKEYGKISVTTGSNHMYCGMDLIFTDREVHINMVEYLKDVINEFGSETCAKKVSLPAALHLFNVDPNQLALDDEKSIIFHKMVAKLLFVSKHSRPNIQVAIAFLTTRVTKPDVDDWEKLVRLLCYLNSTIDLKLKLSIQNFRVVKWWVDAS